MRKWRKRKKKDLHLSLTTKRNGSLGPEKAVMKDVILDKNHKGPFQVFSLSMFFPVFLIFKPGDLRSRTVLALHMDSPILGHTDGGGLSLSRTAAHP